MRWTIGNPFCRPLHATAASFSMKVRNAADAAVFPLLLLCPWKGETWQLFMVMGMRTCVIHKCSGICIHLYNLIKSRMLYPNVINNWRIQIPISNNCLILNNIIYKWKLFKRFAQMPVPKVDTLYVSQDKSQKYNTYI